MKAPIRDNQRPPCMLAGHLKQSATALDRADVSNADKPQKNAQNVTERMDWSDIVSCR